MQLTHNGKLQIGSNFNESLGYHLQLASSDSDNGVLGLTITGNNTSITSYAGSGNNSNLIFRTSSVGSAGEKMQLTHNGKLQIGSNFNESLGYHLQLASSDSDNGVLGLTITGNNTSITSYAGSGNSSDLIFRTSLNGQADERFRVTSDGNVGIGTTSPQNKLSVEGTISKEVKVSLTDAADWVFEDDYELRSLEEVESFVKTNKHLPDIPSADEFRENDLSLGEMNNKLLQKIEELTLYLIDQNKRLDTQQKEIQELRTKIED